MYLNQNVFSTLLIFLLNSVGLRHSNKKQKIGRRILITLLHELNDIMQLIASPTRN